LRSSGPWAGCMVVGWTGSVNGEMAGLFHDNLGPHAMARQVTDVVERAGGLRGEPELDPRMGRKQEPYERGLSEFGCAVSAYLDVGALQEQQGDEGVHILIVVTDDQRGRLSLRQGQRLRGECPFAGDNLNRG